MSKRLLIVAHAPSRNTRALLRSVRAGAESAEINGVSVHVRLAAEAVVEDVIAADAVILGTTENLAYMAGTMKDFFDRTYYGVIGRKAGMPYALYVRAGSDGTGTVNGVERIITGLGWRAVQSPTIMKGPYSSQFEAAAKDLGMGMAAGLEAGIF